LGVLQRFERRLEGMVEGAFARAFRSELQPVEVASAVQREMDDRAAIVAKGRTLVPNDFVVELADSDHERLEVYAESLGVELANLARDYAKEQGYSFVGPVRMRFEGARSGSAPASSAARPSRAARSGCPPATCRGRRAGDSQVTRGCSSRARAPPAVPAAAISTRTSW
jgi:hypothetical protein